ncbi:MAG: AAA family ATPase [Alicyclobacillus sp.]|nr:AAA family ATPase [Alicyclobacillus sp.]
MIKKIIKLRGIGLLHDALPSGALELKPLTTIYAENGRGKSTFAAICQSLATGDATLLRAKDTIGGSYSPHVAFRINDSNYELQDGKWSGEYQDILVFDEQFVETNVCIGSRIEPIHRENLLEFVLGEEGVRLKEEIDSITDKIDSLNKDLRTLTNAISQHKGPFTVDEFVHIQPANDVDAKLHETQQKLQDAESVDAIRRRPEPVLIRLPEFDMSRVEQLLSTSLQTVVEDAERMVREHIEQCLDTKGEGWLRQGLRYLEKSRGCPFCGQEVRTSDLVKAYKDYFSAAYDKLKSTIENALRQVDEDFGEVVCKSIEADLDKNKMSESSWADRPNFLFPSHIEAGTWTVAVTELRNAALELLNKKLSEPLSKMTATEKLSSAYERYTAVRSQVALYNETVENARLGIEQFKKSLENASLEQLREEIRRLETEKKRLDPQVVDMCSRFKSLNQEKNDLETNKSRMRESLDRYTGEQLKHYKEEINGLLRRFNASFRIGEITVKHTGGTPRTEYGLQIMGEKIPVNSQKGRSFSNTLSAGDKKTLALAFFLARLMTDPERGKYIVVIDDPVSSLDIGRRRATREVLTELLRQCAQLIVLSHDAHFLRDFIERVKQDQHVSLQLTRHGQHSVIVECDIYRICREEYYKIYESLVQYVSNGPRNNEVEIAGNIRKYLEHNLRNRFPIELEGCRNLGEMIRKVRENLSQFGKLGQRLNDLERINDFSSPYHHLSSDLPPAPADAELKSMVELAFELGRE